MRGRLPERLTPLAARLGVQPLFGDIHNHCALSYGHGSLEDALERARLQLDFVSVTGHAHWPDMPADDPAVAHIVDFHREGFARLRAGWEDHFKLLQRYEEAGRFSVFPGYEIHSSAHGDYTILYADLQPDGLVLADEPAALKTKLRAAKGNRAIAFPHHIGYRQGGRGINWDSFDADLSPFIEMFSMHGCAERSETNRPYLHSMGPVDGGSTMACGLARGGRFGIVANTDHHSGFPGSYGHGRMAAYCAGHSRDSLWQAFRERRTNALTGDNTHLLTAIGDTIQGGVVAPCGEGTLDVEAVAGGFIDHIDIVKNGRLFARVSPELSPSPVAADDEKWETVLFVELGWGARRTAHDWTGTLRLEGGTINGVEPRFRGPEIVSPLEGEACGYPLPQLDWNSSEIRFAVTAEANPNNVTVATQGFAIRLRASEEAVLHAVLNGQSMAVPLSRLRDGAMSGNLGPIDSPAYRFHQLPLAHEWRFGGSVALGALEAGDTIYTRLIQRDGQMAWSSPIHCEGEP